MVTVNARGVDAIAADQRDRLRVESAALMTLLPEGSPGTFEACQSAPASVRVQSVPALYGMATGRRICLYSYPGRVAMFTLTRSPSLTDKTLDLSMVVWQGPPSKGPPYQEPAPWVKDQYPHAPYPSASVSAQPAGSTAPAQPAGSTPSANPTKSASEK